VSLGGISAVIQNERSLPRRAVCVCVCVCESLSERGHPQGKGSMNGRGSMCVCVCVCKSDPPPPGSRNQKHVWLRVCPRDTNTCANSADFERGRPKH